MSVGKLSLVNPTGLVACVSYLVSACTLFHLLQVGQCTVFWLFPFLVLPSGIFVSPEAENK